MANENRFVPQMPGGGGPQMPGQTYPSRRFGDYSMRRKVYPWTPLSGNCTAITSTFTWSKWWPTDHLSELQVLYSFAAATGTATKLQIAVEGYDDIYSGTQQFGNPIALPVDDSLVNTIEQSTLGTLTITNGLVELSTAPAGTYCALRLRFKNSIDTGIRVGVAINSVGGAAFTGGTYSVVAKGKM